jgi:hypothetical protein
LAGAALVAPLVAVLEAGAALEEGADGVDALGMECSCAPSDGGGCGATSEPGGL